MRADELKALAPAVVRYLPNELDVVQQNGGYVRCAVTGAAIRLNDLRYWNVERQEAYASVLVANQVRAAALLAKAAQIEGEGK